MSRTAQTVALAALVVGALSFGVVVKVDRWEHFRGAGLLEAGTPAPPLELADIHGETVNLQSTAAERRLVVVAFWASWCGPCHTELAQLSRLYERHAAEGLEVLAVSVDRDPAAALRYVEEAEVPFVVLLDPKHEVLERYGVQALPTSVLVGPDGAVVRAVQGLRSYLPTQITYALRGSASDG